VAANYRFSGGAVQPCDKWGDLSDNPLCIRLGSQIVFGNIMIIYRSWVLYNLNAIGNNLKQSLMNKELTGKIPGLSHGWAQPSPGVTVNTQRMIIGT